MKRPYVALGNPEVYEYFSKAGPNVKFMKAFHGVMAALFHPNRKFTEHSREAIEDHIQSGRQVVFSLGHSSWFDPSNYASVIRKEKSLKPAIGNIVIPANAPYFNKRVIGKIITTGGAIPTFRRKDVFGKEEVIADAEIEQRRKRAGRELVNICVNHLESGTNVAIFAEGTRNRGDRRRLQKLQNGIGRIIEESNNRDDLMVVCMSAYYGEGRRNKTYFDPSVGVGHLAVSDVSGDLIPAITDCQQTTLDIAVADFKQRFWADEPRTAPK